MKKTATKGAKSISSRLKNTTSRTASKKNAPSKKSVLTTASKKAVHKKSPVDEHSMLLEFLIDEIKDVYWAEKHLVKTLPKMKKAATSQELKNAIGEHLAVTETHVTRLEKVFAMLDKKPQGKKCDAMAGITEEGAGVIEDTKKGTATRDVGIILASQKVEHYEIATYGGLAQLAKTLGKNEIADIFTSILEEEKQADQALTSIAESSINIEASEETEAEE